MKLPQRFPAAEGEIQRILGALNKGNLKMKENSLTGCTSAVPSASAMASDQMELPLKVYRCLSMDLIVRVKLGKPYRGIPRHTGSDFSPKKEREPLNRQNKNCRVTYTSNPLIGGMCCNSGS